MIKLQRNSDGTPKTNHSTHAADLLCDVCGVSASGVDLNVHATYGQGNQTINLKCADIGGSCSAITSWPVTGGTADAVELALVKTA